MPTDTTATEKPATTEIAALLALDPEGGWDHDSCWSDDVRKSLRMAIALGDVEKGVSFDIEHWRLTDEGIKMRQKLDGMEAIRNRYAEHFKPIDWSESFLGRDIWMAWNALESAIFGMQCAQANQMTDAIKQLDEAKRAMQRAMKDRDRTDAR